MKMETYILIVAFSFITHFSFAGSFNEAKVDSELVRAYAHDSVMAKYQTGERPLTKKQQALIKSLQQGDAKAQFKFGVVCYNGGTLSDKEEAFYWFTKSAEKGNAGAQLFLGDMYRAGEATVIDKEQAIFWYKKSAEQGNARAQWLLGKVYDFGEGILIDKEQAFYWYKKSAEQDYAPAQYSLGDMYLYGRGTDRKSVV